MQDDLANKISQAINELFVGNVIFTPEELEELYSKASSILRYSLNNRGVNISYYDYNLIFVAIVNIAKEWNSNEEEALYRFVYKKLLGTNVFSEQKAYKQITSVVDFLGRQKKVFILSCYIKKYYATICSHAFAPRKSMESFFDMCWEIYLKDLDQQYSKNDPVYLLIADSLATKFNSGVLNEDNFQIGSNIYSIMAGVKGLAIDQKDNMVKLLDFTIRAINSLFNKEPLKNDKYLNQLINSWWKEKERTLGLFKPKQRINSSESVVSDYSKIRAKYVLDDGVAKIIIPSFCLKDNFDYDPYIEIYVDGKLSKNERLDTKGSGIIMMTYQKEYELSSLNSLKILIKITHCDKVIYDSKTSLFRDFIIFNDRKEIISNECIPGLYYLYIPEFNILLQYPDDIHRVQQLLTYSFTAKENECLQSKNKTVFFLNEKLDRSLYFFANQIGNAKYLLDDEEYKIIDGELYVDIDENLNDKEYGVRYEDISYKLIDFDYQFFENRKRYCVTTLLRTGKTQRISIFKYGEDNKPVCNINLIKFNNIRINYDKPFYYGNNEIGNVQFLTENYNVTRWFNISEEEISIPIEMGEVIVRPPVFRWKLDDYEWHNGPIEKGIWFKKLNNSTIATLSVPKDIGCFLDFTKSSPIEKFNDKMQFKVGQTLYAIKDRVSMDSIILFSKLTTEETLELTEIYLKEKFIGDPIFLSTRKELIWQPEYFIGDEDASFKLEILKNGKTVFQKNIDLHNDKIDVSSLEDDYYDMQIVLLSKGFLSNNKILYKKEIMLGDEKELKFKNKVMVLNKIMPIDSANPIKIKPVYVSSIKYLGTKDNFDYYSGKMYLKSKNNQVSYLNSMRDEFNHFEYINPIRIELKTNSTCYIGYGLDINDEDFEFTDEFVIDNERKITICKTMRKGMKGIDYFLFEVKSNV